MPAAATPPSPLLAGASAILDWIAEPLTSQLVSRGLITALLAGAAAATAGCWVVLRDLPYAAESMSHGMFPGIIAAALIGAPIAIGGLAGLLLAAGGIAIARRFTNEADTATALAITPLTGLGAVLAISGDVPAGAGHALFGDVLGTGGADIAIAAVALAAVAGILTLWHWRLLASGMAAKATRADVVILATLALATIAAAGSLGSLLTVALVLGPAAAARSLCRRAGPMLACSAAISAVAVLAGIEISWHADLATGPTIAICAIIPPAAAALATRTAR